MNQKTYYINVNQGKLDDFVKLLESLKSLGVISSFETIQELVKEGEQLTDDQLQSIVTRSRSEITEGKFYSHDDAKKLLQEWMKKK